jgi:hypothetical protein
MQPESEHPQLVGPKKGPTTLLPVVRLVSRPSVQVVDGRLAAVRSVAL